MLLVREETFFLFMKTCNFFGTVCPPFHKRLSIWRSLQALDEVAWFLDQRQVSWADI